MRTRILVGALLVAISCLASPVFARRPPNVPPGPPPGRGGGDLITAAEPTLIVLTAVGAALGAGFVCVRRRRRGS